MSLKELNDVLEISTYFKELAGKPNAKHQFARIYSMAYDQQELLEKQWKLEEQVPQRRGVRVINTTIISDDLAILEIESKGVSNEKMITFQPAVNGKVLNESADHFDTALLAGICAKYDGSHSSATGYIYNMLQMGKKLE